MHGHLDCLLRLARDEGQGAVFMLVVDAHRRIDVRGRIVQGHFLAARCVERHRERQLSDGVFETAVVRNGHRRRIVVVQDRDRSRVAIRVHVLVARDRDREGLVGLIECIVIDYVTAPEFHVVTVRVWTRELRDLISVFIVARRDSRSIRCRCPDLDRPEDRVAPRHGNEHVAGALIDGGVPQRDPDALLVDDRRVDVVNPDLDSRRRVDLDHVLLVSLLHQIVDERDLECPGEVTGRDRDCPVQGHIVGPPRRGEVH